MKRGNGCILMVLALLLGCLSARADEVMMPRGKEAYEKHLKELEAKYGVKDDAQLKSAVVAAGAHPVPAAAAAAPATTVSGRTLAGVAVGSRLRVALLPVGADRFSFDGQSFDVDSLTVELQALAGSYTLDTLVLMEQPDAEIQALHLVELSKLSAAFGIPALYQRGDTLQAVAAARR